MVDRQAGQKPGRWEAISASLIDHPWVPSCPGGEMAWKLPARCLLVLKLFPYLNGIGLRAVFK